MNQESLERANAFLAAVASRAGEGDLIDLSPAELGREIGVNEPLAAARAIRALLARRRLEAVDGSYRLLDRRPIEVGEREQVPRPRRSKRGRPRAGTTAEPPTSRRTSYSDIGRETVERLVELGREVGTLRGAVRTAREEARDATAARNAFARSRLSWFMSPYRAVSGDPLPPDAYRASCVDGKERQDATWDLTDRAAMVLDA